MDFINGILAGVVGGILRATAGLHPLVPLCLLALVSGVVAGVCFRYTSSQRGLKRASDLIRANLLGMRLFGDDAGAVLRSLGGLMLAVLARLGLSLPPMVVMIVPFAFLLAQMAMWYEFRPLRPGERALLEIRVQPDAFQRFADLKPELPADVVLAGPVRDARSGTISWELRPMRATGPTTITWRAGGETFEKRLWVAERDDRIAEASPMRPGVSLWERLLYPAERAFGASSAVQEIRIAYPTRSTPVFGWNVPWWLTFLVVSIVGALALKPFMKVQF